MSITGFIPISPTAKPKIRVRIVFTWVSVMLAIFLYAFVWFIVGLVLMPIIDLTAASYSFSSSWTDVVTLIKAVILYHPIIAMLGWIIWGALNSSRHDAPSWEG